MQQLASVFLLLFINYPLLSQSTTLPSKVILSNEWVDVARVRYEPYGSSSIHTHPSAQRVIYVYITNGGILRFRHLVGPLLQEVIVDRPPVVAGSLRIVAGHPERHLVEYLGDQPTEYLAISLKTHLVGTPREEIVIPALVGCSTGAVRHRFEDTQIKIVQISCEHRRNCPDSNRPDLPSLVILLSGEYRGDVRWSPTTIKGPLEAIRIELKTGPK
jgi:hypothetical protein